MSQFGEDEIYIVVGSNSLSKNSSFKKSYSIKKLFAHEGFSNTTIRNDIGLIQLNDTFKFNRRVKPIKLPVEKDLDKANYVAAASGWGRMEVIMKEL